MYQQLLDDYITSRYYMYVYTQLLGYEVDTLNSVQFSNNTGTCIHVQYLIQYYCTGKHTHAHACC